MKWLEFSEIIRNFGIFFGGAFGLYLGWLRVTVAKRQAEARARAKERRR